MKKVALLIAPWLLIAITTVVFRRLAAHLGPKRGYFGGFHFYWIFWCLLSRPDHGRCLLSVADP
jgi:hypothetical protein